MMIILGKNATYCGDQSVLYEARSYIRKLIEESKKDPLFIKSLNSEEKEKYRNEFEFIDNIYGLSEEEQKYYEKLNSYS